MVTEGKKRECQDIADIATAVTAAVARAGGAMKELVNKYVKSLKVNLGVHQPVLGLGVTIPLLQGGTTSIQVSGSQPS